jgi:hypothetical protein
VISANENVVNDSSGTLPLKMKIPKIDLLSINRPSSVLQSK